jgi:hypothetical protein
LFESYSDCHAKLAWLLPCFIGTHFVSQISPYLSISTLNFCQIPLTSRTTNLQSHQPSNSISALTSFRKETEDGRSELELHGFEVAALMNLVATDTMVEEAVALIPSLGRFPESAVDEILELIRSTMIRIVSYA